MRDQSGEDRADSNEGAQGRNHHSHDILDEIAESTISANRMQRIKTRTLGKSSSGESPSFCKIKDSQKLGLSQKLGVRSR